MNTKTVPRCSEQKHPVNTPAIYTLHSAETELYVLLYLKGIDMKNDTIIYLRQLCHTSQ